MKKGLEHRIEEILLICLILLNIFDFFEYLPADIDFLKKIISWASLLYLLYKASLTKLFFGQKKKILDLTLIANYFLFTSKNIVFSANLAVEEPNFFSYLYYFFINNANNLLIFSFYLGGVLLLVHTVILAYSNVKKPSLMAVLHEEGIPKTNFKKVERLLIVFFVLVGFFVIVFNLMMEWLAISIDASLLVFVLLFYFFTSFRRHYKRLNAEHFIFKVGTATDNFYERFIELFHSKKNIFLGISGMLVLHLLTDVGNFIIPYVLGIHDALYFKTLGASHDALIYLLKNDLFLVSGFFNKLSLISIYMLNLAAMLVFLIAPSYIWVKLYKKKKKSKISRISISLIYMSIIAFILVPTFKITEINKEISFGSGLIGVDIKTNSVFRNNISDVSTIFLIILFAGVLIYFFCDFKYFKEKALILALILINAFVAYYIYLFIKTSTIYYADFSQGILYSLFRNSNYFAGIFLALFYVITMLFYKVSFFIFLRETKKEFRYMH